MKQNKQEIIINNNIKNK